MALTIRTTGIEDYLDGGEAYVKALVAGLPSAGKTRSASFWPKPIFADCEKGRMSIADRSMPYGEVLSTDDMVSLLTMLKIECRKPVAQRKYQTLVIDTIDAYQRIVVTERLNAERKEAFSGYADWGYLDAKMTQLIASLLALPMNIVVNMHVKEHREGEDGPVTIQPKLKGDIRDQIAAEFDLVGFMGTSWVAEKGERVLKRHIQWHPDPRTPWLKDRSGRLPRFTEVNFDESDYTGLFLPLSAALDSLSASEDLETLETAQEAAVVPPGSKEQEGGAVAQPTAPLTPAKKAAAKKAAAVKAAPKPALEVREIPAPEPTTPVAAGAEPAPEDPGMTTEEITAAVGGTVIAEIQGPEDEEPATTPVASPPPTAVPAAAPPATERLCGQPGKKKDGSLADNPISGCGKSLADESRDVVNIGFIRTTREGRPTYLCAACIAAHKAATAQ